MWGEDLEADRIVEANRTARSMFGLPAGSSLLGMAPWELSPQWQPDGTSSEDLARQHSAQALEKGAATFEWLHQRLDTGATFPCEVDISSLHSRAAGTGAVRLAR